MKAYEECKYSTSDVEKIINFSSWSDIRKIDTLFHIDCVMYCNLGKESSPSERRTAKFNSRTIYKAIKTLNSKLGELLLKNMD
tara:strand:+ start:1599 stop:1847 length:249 start_codon:yes stop_codon:yes gene_type:complete